MRSPRLRSRRTLADAPVHGFDWPGALPVPAERPGADIFKPPGRASVDVGTNGLRIFSWRLSGRVPADDHVERSVGRPVSGNVRPDRP